MASATFRQIKDAEQRLIATGYQPPAPYQIVTVGTIRVGLRRFVGLGAPASPVGDLATPPRVDVTAVMVGLAFALPSYRGVVEVRVNGRVYTGRGPRVVVPVGRAAVVHWTLTVAGQTYASSLVLRRPPILGVGAFVIPVLPITILYAPPRSPSGAPGTSTYGEGTRFGCTVSTTLTSEHGETHGADLPPRLHSIAKVRATLDGLAALAGMIPEVGGPIKGALQAVGTALLGHVSSQATETTIDDERTELTVEVALDQTYTASEDQVHFYRAVEVVWVADAAGVYLTVLGARERLALTLSSLRSDLTGETNHSRLGREDLLALLALDPFVAGGPFVDLAGVTAADGQPRFVPLAEPQAASGDSQTFRYATTEVSVTTKAYTTMSTVVTEYQPALLTFLGLGVEESGTVRSTTTVARSDAKTEARTASVTFALDLDPVTPTRFRAWQDLVFGTCLLQLQRPPRRRPRPRRAPPRRRPRPSARRSSGSTTPRPSSRPRRSCAMS